MSEFIAARDLQQMRLAVMITRTLDTLRGTIRLEPHRDRAVSPPTAAARSEDLFVPQSIDDVRATFTDESERVIGPLVVKADILGAMQPKHLAALRTLVLDYIGKSGYIEEFTRVIQGDTVTIEELMLIVMATADHAEMVERTVEGS